MVFFFYIILLIFLGENMQKFQSFKTKKRGIELLQFIVIGVFFFLAFQQEAVYIAKETLSRLNVGADIEFLIAQTWASVKMILNSPSIISLFYFVAQLLCLSFVAYSLVKLIFFVRGYVESKVETKDEVVDNFVQSKKLVYLEISRLLI
jgi:hypothetical protein